MHDIAVILINYNTSKYTLECIDAVYKQTRNTLRIQVIVVDNNSAPEDFKNLKDNFPKRPDCSLHRSIINTGFGGGNMHGSQFANAEYLLFLNNDAMLLNDCLSILKHYMDAHAKVGVCTAQNYDEKQQLVPSFDHNKGLRRLLLGRGYLEKSNPKRYPKRKATYTEPLEVDWINGAFLFFRKTAFEIIGGFDTNIFLYWEEMDVCNRLRKAGYSSWLISEAKILHYQGVSTGSSKPISNESYISYLYVIKKNKGYLKYLIIKCYLVFVISIKPKKWYLLAPIIKGNALTGSLKQQQKIRYV
jgi:GT2 family glycosyltransferase